jgi:hypothetical protein
MGSVGRTVSDGSPVERQPPDHREMYRKRDRDLGKNTGGVPTAGHRSLTVAALIVEPFPDPDVRRDGSEPASPVGVGPCRFTRLSSTGRKPGR